MKAKAKTEKAKVKFSETFTSDSVTIEQPGSYVTYSRQQVEGWLSGMNIAKGLASDEACRQAVADTVTRGIAPAVRARTVVAAPHAKSTFPTIAVALIIALSLFIGGRTARCSEIIRGYAPQDGQQLYAADLDNLIDESTIGVQFYNDQQTTPILGGGYYFLVLNPANQSFYRISAQQVLYGNTNLFLNAPPQAVPAYGWLLFYDPTNGWVASTTVSNFLWNSASNINVAGLSFANTNNGSATMQFVLPKWPYPVFSALGQGTNFPVHFLIFDTNGIPYREGLSNLELNVASDMGTVFALPWEYEQEFFPWKLYGTNTFSPLTGIPPFTNAFGWTTNFPITAYFQTNNSEIYLPTLTDTDSIPINSAQQNTNTSATLLSIYEYLTNKNTLPPYTMARAQFSGIYAEAVTPGGQSITNMDPVTGIITNIAMAINWSNPAPVSWQGKVPQIPTVPTVQSNTLYWAQVTNMSVLSFQIFTNLACAVGRSNAITGNGVSPTSAGTLLWLTNYTSVNCAVIQACDTTTIEPGIYDCFFLTPSQTPYYYLTGSGLAPGQNFNWGTSVGFVNFPNANTPGASAPFTTNGFEFQTTINAAQNQDSLVQILIQPQ